MSEEEDQRKKRNCDCDLPNCNCDLPCGCDLLIAPLLLVGPAYRPVPRARVSAPARVGATAIRGYQRWLSPRLPTRCRMAPTCSQYGLEAVRRYGLVRGGQLAAVRIKRCGRTHRLGTPDPVP